MEQATIEKVEALYVKQIERLERQCAEAVNERLRERQAIRQEFDERRKECQQNFNDREKELLAQNDGMLGAIGRLHSENQTLKQDLLQAQMRAKKYEENMEQMTHQAHIQVEEAHLRMDERVNRIKEEAAREIRDLKKQIEELKGKGKKKA